MNSCLLVEAVQVAESPAIRPRGLWIVGECMEISCRGFDFADVPLSAVLQRIARRH
jgi:hypothetical protein